MNQAFYDGMVIRIQGGQYTLDEIDTAIDKAAGKGFFGADFDVAVIELKALARQYVDVAYKGNTEPRSYDLLQDIEIEANSMATLEIFEAAIMFETGVTEAAAQVAELQGLVAQLQERVTALEELTTTPSLL